MEKREKEREKFIFMHILGIFDAHFVLFSLFYY